MKINSIKIQNYKLFKYNLLKLQIYSNKFEKYVLDVSINTLEQIEAYFKQALKIIFEYHKKQFKILFVGFPVVSKVKQIKLIHFTNHNFISQKS
jgi:ribosomal protein S2